MLLKKTELVVIKETSKQFGIVRSLLHRKDVSELVIATDAGERRRACSQMDNRESRIQKTGPPSMDFITNR